MSRDHGGFYMCLVASLFYVCVFFLLSSSFFRESQFLTFSQSVSSWPQ